MTNQFFKCPRCQAANAVGVRFCSNCGVAYAVPASTASPQPVKKQSFPGWAIALIASVGLCGVCGIVGSLTNLDKNKPMVQQSKPSVNQATPFPTPTPKPTFAELKFKGDDLLKFSKNEYEKEDLKPFDDLNSMLREIPKDAKEYKEAQILIKKLIDKSAPIAAEILVLGPKPRNSEWDGRVDPVVEYLKDNLNDYEDSEWLEWSPVTKVTIGKEPYWAVRLKLRAKNAFGGKILKNVVFLIRNNQVVQTTGL